MNNKAQPSKAYNNTKIIFFGIGHLPIENKYALE